jgi:hypothetical protein
VRTPTRTVFFAAAAGLLAFFLWRRLFGPRRREHPASTFLTELEHRLDALAVHRNADEDLEALTRRLAAEGHQLAPPLQKATRRYLEARFGARPLSRDERRALLGELKSSPVRP